MKSLLTLNAVENLGVMKLRKLLESFGTPEAILNAKVKDLNNVEGVGPIVSQKINHIKEEFDIDGELDLIQKNNVRIVTIFDEEYPQNLKEIYNPPVVLYVKGKITKEDNSAIAMVGSRRASFYGQSIAEKFGYELAAKGLTVVSGMARGVDTLSHKGALKANGRTIAVLGSGLLNIYPPENRDLFAKISEAGAVISEFPLTAKPLPENFPRRNRIIAGLSLGVVVVEAAKISGSLITARFAMEEGREVFAVPGKIDAHTSKGTNDLIKDGAKLVQNCEDIIEEIFPHLDMKKELAKRPSLNITPDEEKIYEMLSSESSYVEELVRSSNLSISQVLNILMKLEIKKLVKQLAGKRFVKI